VPIFLHGGVLHILFNLLVQLRLGADMEKVIGTFRFVIVYFVSGIMGFILGANFAGNGIASTGCSGSLFGIIALVLLVPRPYLKPSGKIQC
jgi:membrane associated rhomboid family serine protease